MSLASQRGGRRPAGDGILRARIGRAELIPKAAAPRRRALPRETKFAGVALEKVEADGTFSGYASLFGAVDLAKDVVERGAFRKSLADRGAANIRMLYQHDANEPIGVWLDVREDAHGLFVRGRLTPDVARAKEVLALMRAGALDGLSIGFRTVRARKDAESGVRRILEVDLWEISVVTFPMLPGARVESVKQTDARMLTIRVKAASRKMRSGARA